MTLLRNDAQVIRARVDELARNWSGRQNIVKTWYDLIGLDNNLQQENMESVISNDPRTSYNMAKWLLTPKAWSFVMDKENLSDIETISAGSVETQVNREVANILRRDRTKLHGSTFSHAIGLLLTTGWIALSSLPVTGGTPHWSLSAWHPLTVFPHYDGEGNLVELARKYAISREEATIKAFREQWLLPSSMPPMVTIRTLWVQTTIGAFFVAMIEDQIVRMMDASGLDSIPVVCLPAGGLPDDGTVRDDKWREEIGQSIVASVMDLQKDYNRMLTYIQQLLRDSANAKWVERVEGDGVLTSDSLYKRGSIYTINIGEDIFPLTPGPLPIDARTHSFDLRNQIQRGLFNDQSFGGGDIGAFAMSQVTGSAKQVLEPFQTVLVNSLGASVSRNIVLARKHNQPVGGRVLPDNLPEDLSLDFLYDLEIPGDFLQRANAARILNPNFKMSSETLTRTQFPEVRDPFQEQQRVITEDALQHPVAIEIKLIREMQQAAAQANLIGDYQTEALFARAAETLTQQLLGPSQDQTQGAPVQPNNIEDIFNRVGA